MSNHQNRSATTGTRSRFRPLPLAFTATVLYEFRMAIRGKMLWLSVLPLLAVALLIMITSPRTANLDDTMAKLATWAVLANMITTVGTGVSLADRFVRIRGLGLTELLSSAPASVSWRMAGTLLGALTAALAPVAALLLILGVVTAATDGAPATPLWAALALLTVVVPGALLLSTFAATLALFLPLPPARVIAVLAWFWTTVFSTRLVPLPTPTGTLLSPLGDYAGAGWLHADVLWAGRGSLDALAPAPSATSAMWSVLALLALSGVLFLVARSTAAVRS
jgi:ABC-2 type transport system permease protein